MSSTYSDSSPNCVLCCHAPACEIRSAVPLLAANHRPLGLFVFSDVTRRIKAHSCRTFWQNPQICRTLSPRVMHPPLPASTASTSFGRDCISFPHLFSRSSYVMPYSMPLSQNSSPVSPQLVQLPYLSTTCPSTPISHLHLLLSPARISFTIANSQ